MGKTAAHNVPTPLFSIYNETWKNEVISKHGLRIHNFLPSSRQANRHHRRQTFLVPLRLFCVRRLWHTHWLQGRTLSPVCYVCLYLETMPHSLHGSCLIRPLERP